jgi:hypothetical protein
MSWSSGSTATGGIEEAVDRADGWKAEAETEGTKGSADGLRGRGAFDGGGAACKGWSRSMGAFWHLCRTLREAGAGLRLMGCRFVHFIIQ